VAFPAMTTFVVLVLCALSSLHHPAVALAQQSPKAGVVTATQGESTLTRPATPGPVPVKAKDAVLVRDRIDTQENAIVRLLLGGKAVVTVRELAVFTVTEESGRATVDVKSGKVALGVAKQLLRPGEAVEIRAPNAIAAVRGSAVYVDTGLDRQGNQRTTVATLHVSLPVEVSIVNGSGRAGLGSNQITVIEGTGAGATITPPANLTPGQIAAITPAFDAPRANGQSPSDVVEKLLEDFLQQAVDGSPLSPIGPPAPPPTRPVAAPPPPPPPPPAAAAPPPPPPPPVVPPIPTTTTTATVTTPPSPGTVTTPNPPPGQNQSGPPRR